MSTDAETTAYLLLGGSILGLASDGDSGGLGGSLDNSGGGSSSLTDHQLQYTHGMLAYASLAAMTSGLVSMVGTAGASAWAGASTAESVVMAAPVTSGTAEVEDWATGAVSTGVASVAAVSVVAVGSEAIGSVFSTCSSAYTNLVKYVADLGSLDLLLLGGLLL